MNKLEDKINIATSSNRQRDSAQLLVIHADQDGSKIDSHTSGINYLNRNLFTQQFKAGDVVVANAAATLPASFSGTHCASGVELELRLAQNLDATNKLFSHWKGFVFGKGNWRMPTESRTKIPTLKSGDRLCFDEGLQAEIIALSTKSERFIEIKFLAGEADLLHKIYQAGRLIQYSYHQQELDLWDGQTIFAGKPIAIEAPSASFMLTWEMILDLQNRGVEVVSLHHAAGISSTGEQHLDALLPLPEYFEIPEETAAVINCAKQEQRRVIALGTSVTRALESAADQDGNVRPGSGIATLLLTPSYPRKVVTGLVTGMHEDGTSHLQLLQSFAPWKLIEKAYSQAKKLGYLWHEYGDSCLIFA
ncbi:MAG: S-adenosylmethionine:tRNA ribosyltransferase-isomerase [Anaerolineae bacterium]